MQLMWLSGPVGNVRSIAITRTRLLAIAALAALLLVLAGNVLHYIGLRIAVAVRPEIARAFLGEVLTATDLAQIEDGYRGRLARMRDELADVGRQVAELRTLKDGFLAMALPRGRDAALPSAPPASTPVSAEPPRPDETGAPRMPGAGAGGPWRDARFDPASVGSALAEGAALFHEIDASRRELRALSQWIRAARVDWGRQLAWAEALPTGPALSVPAPLASRFGVRLDPFTGTPARHDGIDLVAPSGTPILAAGSGTVLRAQRNPQYGWMVDIDHGNGYQTRYAHARSLQVKAGERIRRGTVIATVGSTGRSTGPHLHFEVRYRGALRNPEGYLPRP